MNIEHNPNAPPLTMTLGPAQATKPVAWAVYNGWSRICFYMTEEDARDHAQKAQKNHDLSGSLAAFRVVPLYAAPQPPAQAAKRVDAKARMDWAESILKNLPETEPTYSIIKLLNDYDQDERDEILQSIRAYADCRATQALFTQYSAAQADAREGLTDEQRSTLESLARTSTPYEQEVLRSILAAHPGQPEPRAEVTGDTVLVPKCVVKLLRIINRYGIIKRDSELQGVYRLVDAARAQGGES